MWLGHMHTKATIPGRIAWAAGESPAGGGARADVPAKTRAGGSFTHSRICIHTIDRTVGGSLEAHHARGTLVCMYVWGLGRTWQALLS